MRDETIEMQDETVAALVRALVAYLRAHPSASDTAAGISQWWLGTEEFVTYQHLERALRFLIDRGVVEEIAAADGRKRYRRIGGDETLAAAIAATGLH
jgi:hypothetical protein